MFIVIQKPNSNKVFLFLFLFLSAKSFILQASPEVISFMYKRNKIESNTNPWETPAYTSSQPDEKPSCTTFCFLSPN
jgi:hypothetical protein